jgi:hypothetical protein
MRRTSAGLFTVLVLAAMSAASTVSAQFIQDEPRLAPKPAPKPAATCTAAAKASAAAARVRLSTKAGPAIAHGEPIEVGWQLPAVAGKSPVYLVGAMPDTVRFEGSYRLDSDGTLQGGPGFVALPGKSRAPHGIVFGEDRTRVVIPINDPDTPRAGTLRIKPYAAGPLAIEWAVVAVDPACRAAPEKIAVRPLGQLGPFAVAAGAPRIVVQDFVAPDPTLEFASAEGGQKLQEVEVSNDGRYRLEIFPRRYRVFDSASGAKLADRSGVKPRFSPGARFVVASAGDAEKTYPTNLEVIDLVAGSVVASVTGPIVAWSNGDALLLDTLRAYQSVRLFNTLVDPVLSAEGHVASWQYFSPGCGTCDAWVSSNLSIDWDRLAVLRADSDSPRAMGFANVATGRKVETSSFGDEEARPLEARLRDVYGRPDVPVPAGWTSTAPLAMTHVGRGYDGYTDDSDTGSLTPSEAGRRSALDFLAPRRLALAGGRVLSADDLKPLGATRGETQPVRRRQTRGLPFDEASVGEDLDKLGLKLAAGEPVPELALPIAEDGGDPVIRGWTDELKSEILAANPSLGSWFAKSDFPEIVVAAWRLTVGGVRYLLLQHGSPAMTANGAHDLRFDLVALDGPAKGVLDTFAGLSGLYSQFVGRDHTVARVSILGGKRIVVAVPGTGKAEIVQLQGAFSPRLVDLQEPTVLCGFYEAAPRGLVVQANCDGQMFVFDPERQVRPVLGGRVVDNELILYTAEGFYASTYEGAHFVHVAFPGLPGVHSFEQFAKALERRDVIAAIVAGKPLAVAAPVINPPPRIEASLDAGREIVAKARSETGLAFVELHLDGRLSERRPASGNDTVARFSAPMPPHVRSLALVAVDVNGIRSRPFPLSAPASPPQRTNTLHVVAFGVDDYDSLPKLRGARFDAETLVAALKAGAPYYREVRATVRVDREVTPGAAMADLAAAVAAAGPDDTILVFFAGHGGRSDDGRYFMAASTTELGRMPETAIDWGKAADLLGTAKGRVVAVLDACHSGQTGQAAVANDGAVASLAATARAPMIVLAASKGRQESEEIFGGTGGVFTQTLAQLIGANRKTADADQDGFLEVSEVYRGLRQAVDAATGGRQTPWLVRRNLVGDAPLF